MPTVEKGVYTQKEVLLCLEIPIRENNSIMRSSLWKNNSFCKEEVLL